MNIFIRIKVANDSLIGRISESASAILEKINWLYVRLVVIAVGVMPLFFVSGSEIQQVPPMKWDFLPIIFLFGVIGLQLVVGLQAFNPMSASVWLRPAWKHNPFSLKQPLQFFHFAGWLMVASAAPHVPKALQGIEGSQFLASASAAFGFGMLLGVKLSVLIYRRKFTHA